MPVPEFHLDCSIKATLFFLLFFDPFVFPSTNTARSQEGIVRQRPCIHRGAPSGRELFLLKQFLRRTPVDAETNLAQPPNGSNRYRNIRNRRSTGWYRVESNRKIAVLKKSIPEPVGDNEADFPTSYAEGMVPFAHTLAQCDIHQFPIFTDSIISSIT